MSGKPPTRYVCAKCFLCSDKSDLTNIPKRYVKCKQTNGCFAEILRFVVQWTITMDTTRFCSPLKGDILAFELIRHCFKNIAPRRCKLRARRHWHWNTRRTRISRVCSAGESIKLMKAWTALQGSPHVPFLLSPLSLYSISVWVPPGGSYIIGGGELIKRTLSPTTGVVDTVPNATWCQ